MRRRLAITLAATPLILSGGAAVAEGKGAGVPGIDFVTLEPIAVPIVESDRIIGTLRITVVIDAVDAAAAARLTDKLPQVREATMAAATEFARLHASGLRPVNAELLDQNLKAGLARLDPGIAQVLLTEVFAKSV